MGFLNSFYFMKFAMTKIIALGVFTALLMASACKLDDTTISGVPLLDVFSVDQLSNKLGNSTQTFTINANQNQELTSLNGIQLTIPQDIFKTAGGSDFNGNVDVIIKEILTKSEMVLSNKPSVTSDGNIIETIGSFEISAMEAGTENSLTINQEIGVDIDMNGSISNPTALGVYYGTQNDDGTVDWLLDSDSQVPLNSGIYSFDINQLDWVAGAKPLDATTTHRFQLSPSTIDNLVDQRGYLIFNDMNAVAKLNPQGADFVVTDYPDGETATAVMIALDPFFIYMAVVEGVNLTSDQSINAIYNIVSEEELISTLEALN